MFRKGANDLWHKEVLPPSVRCIYFALFQYQLNGKGCFFQKLSTVKYFAGLLIATFISCWMPSLIFHGSWHLCVVQPINGSSTLTCSCQVLLANTLNFWVVLHSGWKNCFQHNQVIHEEGKKEKWRLLTQTSTGAIHQHAECLGPFLS